MPKNILTTLKWVWFSSLRQIINECWAFFVFFFARETTPQTTVVWPSWVWNHGAPFFLLKWQVSRGRGGAAYFVRARFFDFSPHFFWVLRFLCAFPRYRTELSPNGIIPNDGCSCKRSFSVVLFLLVGDFNLRKQPNTWRRASVLGRGTRFNRRGVMNFDFLTLSNAEKNNVWDVILWRHWCIVSFVKIMNWYVNVYKFLLY